MKRARTNFLFPKYARLTRGVARASSILGTLHVRFMRARATHFARVAFQVRAENLPRAQQSFLTGSEVVHSPF